MSPCQEMTITVGNYLVLSPSDRRWMDLVASSREADIFYHPAWSGMLAECYGYSPLVLSLVDRGGEIIAGLPLMEVDKLPTGRRVVALPFSDFCQPLLRDATCAGQMADAIQTWRRECGWPQVEVRWPLPSRSGAYVGQGFFRHVTRLESDAEQVYGRFKKTQVQQCIRQAIKAGVVVVEAQTWEDIQVYYDLHVRTRKRLGVPTQSIRLFRLLWEQLLSKGFGFVLLAYADSKAVAGAVFLNWNQVLTYKFSASDPVHWPLRPNHAVLWRAIRWGCENGYRLFDWGRTDLDDTGLRAFKNGWGTAEHALSYTVLADKPPRDRFSPRARAILALLIKHLPLWANRSIGGLLYGHFA